MRDMIPGPKIDASVRFDEELIRRYDGRGPRYTSYPTALQFDEDFGVDDYSHAARASNESGIPLSLYVHIPFCRSLCYYCACNKIVTRNQRRVRLYLEALHREITLQADMFDDCRTVEQLHFGGGTPTYLDAAQLAMLMQKLDDAFGLDRSDQHEFSIEVDPRSVDAARIRELAGLGFNRLSLGIQDFNPDVQSAVNRVQSVADVDRIVDAARTAAFRSISFDLIYGLPGQSVMSFDTTLDKVVTMRPDRIAVYNYAHLPERFKGQRMIDNDSIPSAETKLKLLQHTIEKLGIAGYVYIGMDHFALPSDDLVIARTNGSLQRNFQGYSTHRHCDLIGLGVSSIGNIANSFSQNVTTTLQYEAMLENDHLPIARGHVVDENDQLRAFVIQELMCFGNLDFDNFNAAHDCDFEDEFSNEIDRLGPLAGDGLIDITRRQIRVSATGRLLLRNIAMVFDRYLDNVRHEKRFSRAI
jgi:oxygen-independent coproporphyrinogen-3 oxidase